MPSCSHLPAIQSADIVINVVRGRNLVAKDSVIFEKAKSSDPYVKIFVGGKKYGRTPTIAKTLNPEWNHVTNVTLGTKQIQKILNGSSKHNTIDILILD